MDGFSTSKRSGVRAAAALILAGCGAGAALAQPWPPPMASKPVTPKPITQAPAARPVQPAPPSTVVAGIVVRARRPTAIDGVVVTALCPLPNPARHPADRDPRVIGSFPEAGARIAPGVVYVRVRYDAPMTCDWDVGVIGEDGRDPCDPVGAWAMPARQSFVTRCVLGPDRHYEFRFGNRMRLGFVGLSGRQAERFKLAFDTTAGPALASPSVGPPDPEPISAYVGCMGVAPVGAAPTPTCRRALVSLGGPPDLSAGVDTPAGEPASPGPPPE